MVTRYNNAQSKYIYKPWVNDELITYKKEKKGPYFTTRWDVD